MSSPITGSSWTIATPGESFCARITNLLSLSSKMKLWFDWAFDSSGNATDDFKSMFLLPPGVIMPYYANGSEEAIKASVEKLNGGTSSSPFWRLCDGTNGTPDLRGRAIIGAGQGSNLENQIFGTMGGSEGITLLPTQLPPHKHQLKTPNGKGIPCWDDYTQEAGGDGNPTCGFAGAQGYLDVNTVNHVLGYKGTPIMTEENTAAADQQPVKPYPPYTALWYIMRTTRTE